MNSSNEDVIQQGMVDFEEEIESFLNKLEQYHKREKEIKEKYFNEPYVFRTPRRPKR